MSEQLVQLPGHLPLALLQGDDLSIDLSFSEDVSSYTYEAAIVNPGGQTVDTLNVVTKSPTELSLAVLASVSQGLPQNSRWYLTFIKDGKRRTMLAGQVTVTKR